MRLEGIAVGERVGALIRPAAIVLECSDVSVTLWTGDADHSGGIGRHELRRIIWDAAQESVCSFETPNEPLPWDDDLTPMDAIGAAADLPAVTVIDGVSACSFESGMEDRAVQVRITTENGTPSEVQSIFIRLRCSGETL